MLVFDDPSIDLFTPLAIVPTTYADSVAGLTLDATMAALTAAAEALAGPIVNASATTATGTISKVAVAMNNYLTGGGDGLSAFKGAPTRSPGPSNSTRSSPT